MIKGLRFIYRFVPDLANPSWSAEKKIKILQMFVSDLGRWIDVPTEGEAAHDENHY